jgi:tetratricopeptide (TPR) repeat protein
VYELPGAALRAFNNLGDILNGRDSYEEAAAQLEQGIAYARRVGDRGQERRLLGELSWSLVLTGRWQEALECRERVPDERLPEEAPTFLAALLQLHVARGAVDEARRLLSLYARYEGSSDVQERTLYRGAEAVVLRAEGKEEETLGAAEAALAAIEEIGPATQTVKLAYPNALEAALALGDHGRAEELLERVESIPPGRLPPLLRAQALRFRARLAAAAGERMQAEASFKAAASSFREFGMPFWLAVVLTEHAEWLGADDRAGEPERLLAEAREIFTRLAATPWLERTEAMTLEPRVEAASV